MRDWTRPAERPGTAPLPRSYLAGQCPAERSPVAGPGRPAPTPRTRPRRTERRPVPRTGSRRAGRPPACPHPAGIGRPGQRRCCTAGPARTVRCTAARCRTGACRHTAGPCRTDQSRTDPMSRTGQAFRTAVRHHTGPPCRTAAPPRTAAPCRRPAPWRTAGCTDRPCRPPRSRPGWSPRRRSVQAPGPRRPWRTPRSAGRWSGRRRPAARRSVRPSCQ